MRVTALKLANFRSIVNMPSIELGPITVLVGPNNAGKSSLIRALYSIQQGHGNLQADVRVGTREALIEIDLETLDLAGWPATRDLASATLKTTIKADGFEERILTGRKQNNAGTRENNGRLCSNVEPSHFVVPYLAGRKARTYNEDVRLENALSVTPQFNNLSAKLSRLGNPSFPGHDRYVATCQKVLGFVVSAVPSENGQRPGVYVNDTDTISIDQMGEGVPNIVGLLAELCAREGKAVPARGA